MAPLLLLSLFSVSARADEKVRSGEDLFEIHVRPTLVAHCIKCHGASKREGGLDLTSIEGIRTGGDSGPAFEDGKAEESLILEALRYDGLEMPPDQQLADSVAVGFAKWMQAGAFWPSGLVLKPKTSETASDLDWWCYQPVKSTPVPSVQQSEWPESEIDRFVLARLEAAGLQPSSSADAVTLARRVAFTLTGLPPDEATIREAAAGNFDYAAYVDRLLESDTYGENQARFWLDLVRYADSDGYRADHARPEAYRYRDYVIKSFNDDKSYDRFIREQLAGDEIDPGNVEAVTATMYLRHWIYEHNQRDVVTQWHEILSDITETTSDVFLAQGIKCAKCHDHKFDPLLQKDYFRLKAFFAAFQPVEAHPIATPEQRLAFQKQQTAWQEATAKIRTRLREIEYPVALEHATREGFDKFIPEIQDMIRKLPHQRSAYEQQIASLSERQFDLPYDKLDKWLSEDLQKERAELKKQLAEFDAMKPKPLPTMKFVASDVGPTAPVTFITDDSDRKPIEPGYFTLIDDSSAKVVATPEPLQTTGRRSALADWIASKDNPFTARVIVNRIWQQHFGRGLVETASDFGHLGSPPSHPALLDWLAKRFVDDQWSIKKLHRLILATATFRQTSLRTMDSKTRETDPMNILLWRMNSRRLSGEELNDAVLAASGELKAQKRAIYKLVKRNTPDPILAAFDGPDRIRSIGKRHQTTTSTQSLMLANGTWAHARAAAIAKRLADTESGSTEAFVDRLYRALFARSPSSDERQIAAAFLESYAQQTPEEKTPPMKLVSKMPGTGNMAVDIRRKGPIAMSLRSSEALPDSDFTVEATVLLRSLYKDATVNTIVTHWNGSKKSRGWSLSVTSEKSAYKPRNLILQFVGDADGKEGLHYEVVASNLRPELNKPYYVAASVRLSDTSDQGVTFYLKDLSKPDAKMQIASAKHSVTRGIRPGNDLWIASRSRSHSWDGLIDNIRIENVARDLSTPAQADSEAGLPDYSVDWHFEDAEKLGHDASGSGNHAWASINRPEVVTPQDRARVALVHALLNANELIYID